MCISGYGEFLSFKETSTICLEAEITATTTFLERKMFCISKNIHHGMSGGPVLNSNREVIGIVYAGLPSDGYLEGMKPKTRGFISFEDIEMSKVI